MVESLAANDKQPLKATSSVRDKFSAPNFGSRFLTDDQDVFSQNAWDHVPPPSDIDEKVTAALARQRNAPVPEADKAKYNSNPARHWDIFYKHNETNFFKDRKWLHLEFPELVDATKEEAGMITILEVGCGVGNAIFPLLASNKNPELSIFATDYSPRAIQLVKSHTLYSFPPAGRINAAVWDLSSPFLPEGVAPNSVDIVVMIFVLSALHPDEWKQAIANVHTVLKPGGKVVLRDYGRYDLAQLRFKEGRLLEENFYIRGDKTRVYFFTLDDLATIFTGSPIPDTMQTTMTTSEETEADTPGTATPTGHEPQNPNLPSPVPAASPEPAESTLILVPDIESSEPPESTSTPVVISQTVPLLSGIGAQEGASEGGVPSVDPATLRHPLFGIAQLGLDNRLIVNRKRQLKMHRVWTQGKFFKANPNAST
ncbi:hypothetical protein M422DRAFT_24047 [Sphaerobolus stellatus SS14]|nr:hypothetical protein M422DRAFT_24047 [Sphaerobolus stellatus SS14]